MDAVPTPSTVKAEDSTAPETAPAAKANHPTGFRKAKSGSTGAGAAAAKKGKKAEPKTTDASDVTAAEETKAEASTKGDASDTVEPNEPELDENGNPVLYTKSGAKRKQVGTVIGFKIQVIARCRPILNMISSRSLEIIRPSIIPRFK